MILKLFWLVFTLKKETIQPFIFSYLYNNVKLKSDTNTIMFVFLIFFLTFDSSEI